MDPMSSKVDTAISRTRFDEEAKRRALFGEAEDPSTRGRKGYTGTV
jgi:hypothetical protein